MGDMVVALTDAWLCGPAIVGNKAATLSRLSQLGYRVPDGFVITTLGTALLSTHNRVGQAALCREKIESFLGRVSPPWAVRSSCAVEDSRNASFAGVFESVLGVSDCAALWPAVDRVIASGHARAAVLYAEQVDMPSESLPMAVLVQRLISPTCGGVAFSRDPVHGDNLVVIEAAAGSGHDVCHGRVVPEVFVYRPPNDRTCVLRERGAEDRDSAFTLVRASAHAKDVVAEALALRIAKTVCALEEEIGCPQDVEWAIVENDLYILQTRPITALG